jgi:hypothetical protein
VVGTLKIATVGTVDGTLIKSTTTIDGDPATVTT